MTTPTAALAEALNKAPRCEDPECPAVRWGWCEHDAAAILAALPDEWGWREGYAENMNRLLQSNLAYSAKIDRLQAEIARLRAEIEAEHNALGRLGIATLEIARLRKIEEAARALLVALDALGPKTLSAGDEIAWAFARGGVIADLRAALEADR
jgi:hypothetical protein